MLISIVVIISQCIHISNPHILYTFSIFIHQVNLNKAGKNKNIIFLL